MLILMTINCSPNRFALYPTSFTAWQTKKCVIGNGVVIDPIGLTEEIDGLRRLGVKVDGNLFISDTAHVVAKARCPVMAVARG